MDACQPISLLPLKKACNLNLLSSRLGYTNLVERKEMAVPQATCLSSQGSDYWGFLKHSGPSVDDLLVVICQSS